MKSFLCAAVITLLPLAAAAQGLPSANQVYAGPSSGSPAAPSFRALVAADVPGNPSTWTNVTANGVLTTNSAATNTTNINALISTLTAGVGGTLFIPCGTYPLQSISIPAGATVSIIGGGKSCTFLQQDAASLGNHFLSINATGGLHGQIDNVISDLSFSATSNKTGGAFIYTKGTDRHIYRHLIMTQAYYGIFKDGVDRDIYEDIQIYSPVNVGIFLYDGFDCGFTPVSTTTTSNLASGASSFTVTSTSGISVGMGVGDASVGGNYFIGTVFSVVGSTVTLAANSPQPMANGHTVVFGGDCGPTGGAFVKDNWVTGSGNIGVWFAGGIGGIEIQGLEVLLSTSHAINFDTSNSHGLSNREFFFSGLGADSNAGSNLNVGPGSVSRIGISGGWFNASTANYSVQVALQRAQVNPSENGAIINISGSTIGQSDLGCLYYLDQGTLTVTGSDFSYAFGSGASGITIQTNTGVGTVLISGNTFRDNNGYALQVLGTQPASINVSNNIMTGNGTGPITGITSGAGAAIVNNIGYNPVGVSVGTYAPASGATYTAGPSPETHYIEGGTVTAVQVPAAGNNVCTSTPCFVDLGPGETFSVTYSGAPNDVKSVH